MAAGHGIPVIANPVGGLVEQVEDGYSGVVASVATAPAFATAVARLINDSALYNSIVDQLASADEPRSMRAFLGALLQLSCVRQGSHSELPEHSTDALDWRASCVGRG